MDAYLDSTFGAGYMCASATTDYIPTLRTLVRLVKRGSNQILYEDHISYGYELRAGDWVSIAAEQQYFFKDFGALMANPDKSIEGLRNGIPVVTKRIAQDLEK